MGDIEVKIAYDFDKDVKVKCGNIDYLYNLWPADLQRVRARRPVDLRQAVLDKV